MRAADLEQLFTIPWLAVETHTCGPFALNFMFDPDEEISPQRLETEVPAKRASHQTGDEEKQDSSDEQQQRQPDDVLRIDRETEDQEAPSRQIKQDSLGWGIEPRPRQPRQ